ncbi:ADP-ribosylation/Crystallin J1 [Coprinopsis cinerea okayama7|uniref:ADP-ribosylhydrolase ARH3 n=1 Tax=Coprinopsis cinerea (strain Okayama-7 / 130 / ATCC MYA-4618 / FGSC 9003) TaxID=240176 RepID=A8NEQ5_COPC7|nr:ADP-ribosylation/Crystallin J1 [Coprinopsis cinerea okayama7\|eukprot:XP_001833097.2 ADP-ribosylation/Crystallin J1 [Coprinopsis cinerea okayama7\
MVDALGGPPEFKPRFTFEFVGFYIPNRNFHDAEGKSLPPGTWTDDTSMALCLARSIARHGFDEARQLDTYLNWFKDGELSAVGFCFDIGGTTRRALDLHANSPTASESLDRIQALLGGERNAGNGSLMRLIPVPLAFWRSPDVAREYARRSSRTTHPAPLCLEVCEFWTSVVVQILQNTCGNGAKGTFSKLDLLRYISEYPFQHDQLRAALALLPSDASTSDNQSSGSRTTNTEDVEDRYWQRHPILRLIAETRTSPTATTTGFFKLPTAKVLPSSGFVLHSVVAALYCFFATDSFETGAIMAVNLGDDADTTGAIYAGLAACWYGEELPSNAQSLAAVGESIGSGLFWTDVMLTWRRGIIKRDLLEEVADELVRFEKRWKPTK